MNKFLKTGKALFKLSGCILGNVSIFAGMTFLMIIVTPVTPFTKWNYVPLFLFLAVLAWFIIKFNLWLYQNKMAAAFFCFFFTYMTGVLAVFYVYSITILWETHHYGEYEIKKGDVETDNELYLEAKRLLNEKYEYKDLQYYRIIEDVISGKEPMEEGILQVLEKNQETLDVFQRAAQQDYYPEILFKENTVFLKEVTYFSVNNISEYNLNGIRMMRLMALQIKVLHDQEKYTQAEKVMQNAFRFIRHMVQGESNTLLSGHIVNIYRPIFYPIFNDFLQSEHYSSTFYLSLSEHVRFIGRHISFREIMTNEFDIMQKAFIYDLAKELGMRGLYEERVVRSIKNHYRRRLGQIHETMMAFDRNRDSTKTEEYYTDQINQMVESRKNVYLAFGKIIFRNFPSIKETLSEMIAEVIVSRSAPRIWGTRDFFAIHEMFWKQYEIAFALRAYEIEHGSFPNHLAALVPQYLPAVPEDALNYFKPMAYRTLDKGFLLYSVGPDRTDEHGEVEFQFTEQGLIKPEAKGGDIVLSFQKPLIRR